MRTVPAILTILVAAMLFVSSCTNSTEPRKRYCCVDTLVHVDEGQNLTEFKRRGTISLIWINTVTDTGASEEFKIDALFLDWSSIQDSVSGGRIQVDGLPGGGDAFVTVRVSGNEKEHIPPFSSSMYAPPPLDISIHDEDEGTYGDTLSRTSPISLSWVPATFEGSVIRLLLSYQGSGDDGDETVRLFFTLDDNGSYEVPTDALEEFPAGIRNLKVSAFRSYTKCTCQGSEPYVLRSASYNILQLVIL